MGRGTHRVVKMHFSVVELGLEHERPRVGLLRQALDDHVQRVSTRDALHRVHDVHCHYGAEHVVRIGDGGRGDRPIADHCHRVPRSVDQPADDTRQPVRVGRQRLPLVVVVVVRRGGRCCCWRRHTRPDAAVLCPPRLGTVSGPVLFINGATTLTAVAYGVCVVLVAAAACIVSAYKSTTRRTPSAAPLPAQGSRFGYRRRRRRPRPPVAAATGKTYTQITISPRRGILFARPPVGWRVGGCAYVLLYIYIYTLTYVTIFLLSLTLSSVVSVAMRVLRGARSRYEYVIVTTRQYRGELVWPPRDVIIYFGGGPDTINMILYRYFFDTLKFHTLRVLVSPV